MFLRKAKQDNPTDPAPEASHPPGRLPRLVPARPSGLDQVPLEQLVGELLARGEGEDSFIASSTNIYLGKLLQDHLAAALDVHENRFSRAQYWSGFGETFAWIGDVKPQIEGATVVNLGCGGLNPGGFLFLLLMLGAQRGIAIDMDSVEDESRAVRALAECATLMLLDPSSIVQDYPITREQMLRNIASFDLGKLSRGETGGVDESRLCYRREAVHELSLSDGEADVIISVAFLEHIADIDAAIAEMARVTRPGGMGVHIIDCTDHRRYPDPSVHPLAFLEIETDEELVHDNCNRLRPSAFVAAFEANGFEVVNAHPMMTIELTEAERARFAMPYRDMPLDELSVVMTRLVVRRVS